MFVAVSTGVPLEFTLNRQEEKFSFKITTVEYLFYKDAQAPYVMACGVQRNKPGEQLEVQHGEVLTIFGGGKNFSGERWIVIDWGVNKCCKCDTMDKCACIEVCWLPKQWKGGNAAIYPHCPSTVPDPSRQVPFAKLVSVLGDFLSEKGWIETHGMLLLPTPVSTDVHATGEGNQQRRSTRGIKKETEVDEEATASEEESRRRGAIADANTIAQNHTKRRQAEAQQLTHTPNESQV